MAEGQRRLEDDQAQLLKGQVQILNMSAATMSLVESFTSKLCTAIFEATPTSFVILPYKLPKSGSAVSEEEQRSMLDKAEGWLRTVIGLVEEGTKIIDNPVRYAKSFFAGAFKKKITEVKEKMVQKLLFLYLVDEFTYQPVYDKSGVYPIEIETKSDLVDKYSDDEGRAACHFGSQRRGGASERVLPDRAGEAGTRLARGQGKGLRGRPGQGQQRGRLKQRLGPGGPGGGCAYQSWHGRGRGFSYHRHRRAGEHHQAVPGRQRRKEQHVHRD